MVLARKCIANNCNSRDQKVGGKMVSLDASGETVTFHRFPPLMVNEWCDQLKLDPADLKPGFVVCSNHFSDKMFVETDTNDSLCRTSLKKIAYPNINLPTVPGLKRLAIVKRIGRDDETTIKILQSMKQFPCLWNSLIPEYRDDQRCDAALQLVADETKCEEELLMDRIDEIRTNFIQQLAALEENPDDSIQIDWFQEAEFLWDGITGEEISESASLPPMKKKPRLADKVGIKRQQASYPKRCRICLDVQKSNGKSFEELKAGDTLVSMFRKLTSFQVLFDQGNHLPSHICGTCKSSLLSTQEFMERCNQTENILQTVYQCVDSDSAHRLLTDLKRNDVQIKMEVVEQHSDEETNDEPLADGSYEAYEGETRKFEEINKWLDESKTKASRRSQRKLKPTPKARQYKSKGKKPALKIKEEPKVKQKRVEVQVKIKGQSPIKAEVVHRLCPFCGLLPKKNKKNEEHIKKCALNPDRVQDYYMCAHCPRRYTSKTVLLDHLRSKHFNIIIEHKCKFCENVYTSSSAVYAHIRKNHMKDKPHACTVCDKSYAFKFRLDNHIRSTHTKETPFSCDLCDAQRSTRNQLKRHMDTVHATEPVHCTICGKPFKHARYLKIHLAIHTGEKHYKCPVCVMRFSESRHMRSHCARHHPGHALPPKGTILKEDFLPVLKARQERQENMFKF